MEAGELGGSRTESERKLSWLASFHQDATLARSDAAILREVHRRLVSNHGCSWTFCSPPPLCLFFYWRRRVRRVTCTQCSGVPAGDSMTELDSIPPCDMSPAVAFAAGVIVIVVTTFHFENLNIHVIGFW